MIALLLFIILQLPCVIVTWAFGPSLLSGLLSLGGLIVFGLYGETLLKPFYPGRQ